MLRKIGLCIVGALLFMSCVFAGDKNGKSLIHVLHAYERASVPGTPGAVQKSYQFVVVWKGSDRPRNFLWRSANDLVACKVQRAHRNLARKPGEPSPEFITSFIAAGSAIVKDDTLLITPMAGRGSYHGALPSAKNKNALYFNTEERKWYFYSIKNIEKTQPTMMP